jgi:hypothetical protein
MSDTSTNLNFQQLLDVISNEQTFELELLDSSKLNFKQLTTLQLKELIQTVVDSPVTQAVFNSTITKIFRNSLVERNDVSSFNILDRLMFVLETRSQSLSPVKTVTQDDKTVSFNLSEIRAKLVKSFSESKDLLEVQTTTKDKYTLTYCIPTLKSEQQLNDELYKKLEIDIKNVDELRKIIGDAFINEIAKTLQTIEVDGNKFDFSSNTFKNRVKIIETLPASIIQEVITYIEKYKGIIDSCLTVDGTLLTVDGSLFSLR